MKLLFEIVSIAKRVIAHLRKQDLQIVTRAVDFLGNFHVPWECTLTNITGLNMNFTVLYVKLINELSYFE